MSGGDNGYAIRVQGLSKVFKLYASPFRVLREVLTGVQHHEEFWALRDVSFEVAKGEAVGIMGRNGAGKSTLLRILAGTLDRTSGEMDIRGKVSAILELGSGFSHDRTGRENIVNGGLCLGMSLDEIRDKMDGIIDFSELRDFIDHPFRTYSSGMQARLTFATAVAVDPEVLIVDEALSVGDARFQAKCFARIQKFRDEGGTVLLVSHSENTITHFCSRALLLERGCVALDGTAKQVTMAYMDLMYGEQKAAAEAQEDSPVAKIIEPVTQENPCAVERDDKDGGDVNDREKIRTIALRKLGIAPFIPLPDSKSLGTGIRAEILDVAIVDQYGTRTNSLVSGEHYRAVISAVFYDDIAQFGAGFAIFNLKGLMVFGARTADSEERHSAYSSATAGMVVRVSMDFNLWLTNGDYMLMYALTSHESDGDVFLDGRHCGMLFGIRFSQKILVDSIVNLEHGFSFDCSQSVNG